MNHPIILNKSVVILTNNSSFDLSIDNSFVTYINTDTNDYQSYMSSITDWISTYYNDENNIEWVICDIDLNSDDYESMILINGLLPYKLYNSLKNTKFIFLQNGYFYGENYWEDKIEDNNYVIDSMYQMSKCLFKGLSQDKKRVWGLRYDLIDDNLLNEDFKSNEIYRYPINHICNSITKESLSKIINGIINNYNDIEPSIYNISSKVKTNLYQIAHYIAWAKNNPNVYIERSMLNTPINRVLSSIKTSSINKIWKYAGYNTIPGIQELINQTIK